MITEYHRPSTLESAIELLGRKAPETVPLAGGTLLNRKTDHKFAVVDIQDLSLKGINKDGSMFRLGSALTLQELINHPEAPSIIYEACKKETTYNLRQMSTLGGCAAGGGGKSILLAVLLAWNAQLELQPGDITIPLGEILPIRKQFLQKKLITSITFNTAARVSFEVVCKTPADHPFAGVVVAQWPNGRTRVCVFGFGDYPITAMDGPSAAGADMAAKNVFAESGDINASTSYRQDISEILVKRCLERLSGEAV
jgi:CO/xanthine dehydrogenase FAD-binding subunit